MRKLFLSGVALCVGAFTALCGAQPLIDHVPADALVYVGWSGRDAQAEAFKASKLAPLAAESKIDDAVESMLASLRKKLARERDAVEVIDLANKLTGPLWRHPSAFYLTPSDREPRFVLLCQAGDDAAAVEQAARTALREELGRRLALKSVDGFVILTNEPASIDSLLTPAKSLAQSDSITRSKKDLVDNAAIVLHFGADAVREFALQSAPPDSREVATKVLDEAGLSGVHGVTYSAGFVGEEWQTNLFVDAPGPRAGLVGALEGEVDPAVLAVVPKNATYVSAHHFDLNGFVKAISEASGRVDPNWKPRVDGAIGMLNPLLGVNVGQKVLPALGTDWAIYAAPGVGGDTLTGLVVVNKVRGDPKELERSLHIATGALANYITGLIQHEQRPRERVTIATRTAMFGDITVHYVGVPVAAPAWAIDGDTLYAGLYPQTVAAAVRAGRAADGGFARSDALVALLKKLGKADASSFTYVDLPHAAAEGSMYQQWLVVSRYAGIADLFDVPLPEPFLPSLDTLLSVVTPEAEARWWDAAGFHARGVEPFPGSILLSQSAAGPQMLGGGTALATSVMLPALGRAREQASRVKSMSNLKQMGVAMMIYQTSHNGAYPPDLKTMATDADLVGEVFLNPRTTTSIPPELQGAERVAWAAENGDYVYVNGYTAQTANAETILAYENPERVGQGVAVLYGDGHVEWMRMPDFERQLDKQKRGGL
ncbi:MAG: hypothetical protein QM770_14785 [Tepidisphaeraceae bacterium]